MSPFLFGLFLWYHLYSSCFADFTPRIIGGDDVDPGKWPFMVSLQFHQFLASDQHFCGGSILNDNTILTAAHCLSVEKIDASSTLVYIGHVDIASKNKSFVYQAKAFIKNVNFSLSALSNGHDVGVIKLERSIDFGAMDPKMVAKVCIPEADAPPVMDQCVVMGWGITESGSVSTKLKQVTVPMLNNTLCKSIAGGFNMDELLCAGYKDGGGKDSCQGDSGGPLVCPMKDDPTQWLQYGIVSYGDGCAKKPGFYSKVSAFDDWIQENAMKD